MTATNLPGSQGAGLPHCRWALYQLSHRGRLGRRGGRSEDSAPESQGGLMGPKPLRLPSRRELDESCVPGNSLAEAREPGAQGPEGIYSTLQSLQGPHQGRSRGLN